MAYIGTPAAPVATAVGDNAVTTRSIAPNAVTPPKLGNAGSELSFRNRIINGDMRIDQRNNGAQVTGIGNGVYCVDRFITYHTIATLNAKQNLNAVTPPAGFQNYLGYQVTAAASPGASDYCNVQQWVEGYNVSDLNWGTPNAVDATVSFWVYTSLAGTYGAFIMSGPGAVDWTYNKQFTVTTANTWQYVSFTVPKLTGATTASATNGRSIGIGVDLGNGTSSRIGTNNTWTAGNAQGVSGNTTWCATNGATFYITGVQLEAGTVATPFERRDYGRELMMCQRYFEARIAPSGFSVTASAASLNLAFKQVMRATPTITFTSALTITDGVANFTQSSASASGFLGTNTGGLLSGVPNFTGLTALRPVMINVSGFNNPITASAEL